MKLGNWEIWNLLIIRLLGPGKRVSFDPEIRCHICLRPRKGIITNKLAWGQTMLVLTDFVVC